MQRRTVLGAAALALTAGAARAQGPAGYPNKPVRMIVPFAPGGSSDFLAREISPRLAQLLGQPFVVENKAGAAGNLGMETAAAAAPDGYTVFLGNVGTLAINPAIFGKQQKVTAADLAPVSLVANSPDVLVCSASLPVRSVQELVEQGRRQPRTLSFASPGSGSLNRLEMELLRSSADIEMVHVPYRGGAGPALVDVVGGQVSVMFAPIPGALQLIRGGRLRALAVASKERLAQLPDVPTMAEAGYPAVVGGSWQALMVPLATPRPIIELWHRTLLTLLSEDDIRQRLLQGGVEVLTSRTPDELRGFIVAEATRWGAVARASNATAD